MKWLLLSIGALVAGSLIMLRERNLSPAGLELLKEFEGFSATVYRDSAGHPTIGYGHLIKPGESFSEPMSKEVASQLLALDVETAENAVNRLIRVPLSQNMFDALTSFVYNIGEDAFAKSTLRARLNNGDYLGAYREFARWNKAGGKRVQGLANRRAVESERFFA